jgi:hypothetical protein
LGANGLIGAIGAPLCDFLGGIFLKISIKVFKKSLNFSFTCKILSQICHFQSFPSPFTSPFFIEKIVVTSPLTLF